MPGVSAGKVSSCDWWLETGDRGGESVTTHGDISEKMLVHVTGGHEKRKMTMDALIQWWFKSDQYQSKVSKIGFQSWGLTKRLIKPLDFETNNQSKVNPSYFLISFISDCIIQCTYLLVAWRDQFDGGVRAKTKARTHMGDGVMRVREGRGMRQLWQSPDETDRGGEVSQL